MVLHMYHEHGIDVVKNLIWQSCMRGSISNCLTKLSTTPQKKVCVGLYTQNVKLIMVAKVVVTIISNRVTCLFYLVLLVIFQDP